MTDSLTAFLIRLFTALPLAVFLGNGCVVAFNNMPLRWFEDWDPDDSDRSSGRSGRSSGLDAGRVLPQALLDADNMGRQRLASTPWKYLFVGLFGCCGAYLAFTSGIQYEIAALFVMAIVLLMAIADQLYQIVPDQLQIALAVSAIGFLGFNDKWWEPLAGAGFGLAIALATFGLGALLFGQRSGRNSIGGADMKFYVSAGFVFGRIGVLSLFLLTTLFFAIQNVVRIALGKGTLRDSVPMLPAACVAVIVYLVFLYNTLDIFLF